MTRIATKLISVGNPLVNDWGGTAIALGALTYFEVGTTVDRDGTENLGSSIDAHIATTNMPTAERPGVALGTFNGVDAQFEVQSANTGDVFNSLNAAGTGSDASIAFVVEFDDDTTSRVDQVAYASTFNVVSTGVSEGFIVTVSRTRIRVMHGIGTPTVNGQYRFIEYYPEFPIELNTPTPIFVEIDDIAATTADIRVFLGQLQLVRPSQVLQDNAKAGGVVLGEEWIDQDTTTNETSVLSATTTFNIGRSIQTGETGFNSYPAEYGEMLLGGMACFNFRLNSVEKGQLVSTVGYTRDTSIPAPTPPELVRNSVFTTPATVPFTNDSSGPATMLLPDFSGVRLIYNGGSSFAAATFFGEIGESYDIEWTTSTDATYPEGLSGGTTRFGYSSGAQELGSAATGFGTSMKTVGPLIQTEVFISIGIENSLNRHGHGANITKVSAIKV